MAQVINEMDVPSHSFVFHGTGERYFLICVVNVLLTIITLGIYLPWALMKCKRYLYANMEVNGQRFSYGITGGMVSAGRINEKCKGTRKNSYTIYYLQ